MMKKKEFMMEKGMVVLAGTALLCACQPNTPQETSLNGTLTGLVSDTLLVSYRYVNDVKDENMRTSTVVAQQGTFHFPIEKDSLPVRVNFYPIGQKENREIEVLVMPGEAVQVTGTMDQYRVEGSAFYQTYLDAQKLWQPYVDKINACSKQAMEMQKAGVNRDSIAAFRMTYYDYYPQMDSVIMDYIRKHTDEDVALYTAYKHFYLFNDLNVFSDKVKNGPLASLYWVMEQTAQKEKEEKERLKDEPAPEFTLKDLQGKDFMLSSLQGKYVILDFWGSWCVWCIKGFPSLKEQYAKYKGKLEVVGIACHDTEDRWEAAVKKYELPWINVFDGDSSVERAYNVKHFPTKVLIDPEGNIIQTDVVDKDLEQLIK